MSLIITPGQPEKAPEQNDTTENIGEVLDINVATRIAGALDNLNQLEAQTILTPTAEATKRALKQFLNNSFQKHGGELLGAFFSLKGEYEPLIGTLAILFRRVTGTINHMRQQEAANRAAQAKAVQADAKSPEPTAPAN
jgi:hypothetical protein